MTERICHVTASDIARGAGKRIVFIAAFTFFIFVTPTLYATAQNVPADIIYRTDIRYREGDSAAWRLDYAEPKESLEALPAIVIVHGGGWIEGDKSSFDQLIIDWAGLGFFATTIDYRLADATHSTFPQAIEDCKCTIRWLRANAGSLNIDPKRIGVYGNSAGGHLALMLGALNGHAGDAFEGDGPYREYSSDVCSAVSDSGVISLDMNLPGNNAVAKIITEFLGNPAPSKELVDRASPVAYTKHASRLPPFLLLYGTADNLVPIKLADPLVRTLKARHHPDVVYIRYNSVGHCPFSIQQVPGTRKTVEDFLIRTIKGRRHIDGQTATSCRPGSPECRHP